MVAREIDRGQVDCVLQNSINGMTGKTILLSQLLAGVEGLSPEMPAWLQSPGGWAFFSVAVGRQVAEQRLKPIGKPTDPRHDLYLKYRILPPATPKTSELAAQIVRSIEPPACVDYYLKNPLDFVVDRPVIEVITGFLRQRPRDQVTINERAYQLFGDEKFFRGDTRNRSCGESVLKRLGLNYAGMGCVETLEPFFSFHARDFFSRTVRAIYIIENKDTFWSFKKKLMDAASQFRPDMLIYGEGRKILSSFKFVAEYEVDCREDTFFYFGDLDAEGVNLFCELTDLYPEYRFRPFVEGYQAVFEIGFQRGWRSTPKAQRVKPENISRFAACFPPDWAQRLQSLLESSCYIPQEALSASQMSQRFGKE